MHSSLKIHTHVQADYRRFYIPSIPYEGHKLIIKSGALMSTHHEHDGCIRLYM